MHPGFDKYMMQLRMESKEQENQEKPPITSPDVVQTADFVFLKFHIKRVTAVAFYWPSERSTGMIGIL